MHPAAARHIRHAVPALLIASAWLLALALPAGAVESSPPPPGPPFPEPVADQRIYDTAGVLAPNTIRTATLVGEAIEFRTGGALAVFTQVVPDPDPASTGTRAQALLEQWTPGWAALGSGIVVLVEVNETGTEEEIAFAASPAFEAQLTPGALESTLRDSVQPILDSVDVSVATTVAVGRLLAELAEPPLGPVGGGPPADAPDPGPPFPEPELERAVYDTAGVFRADTIAAVEATIDRIEERTGAEIVVYTQVVDYGVSDEETERRARALIDQWGVGRAGFDDGLAIFFDFEPGRDSGRVQLYAAPGFAATYLTNAERQAIFEEVMLPHLRVDDFDAGLLAGIERIDAAATPENAARLQRGRQINAVVGLVGTPVIFLWLVGSAVFAWRRYGRDPVYLDSPSIFVPAPPPGLTAATGALVADGGTSRRALTTAMLDLASRGLIAFREESGVLGIGRKVGIELDAPADDQVEEARRARNARRPLGPAEQLALRRLNAIDTKRYIEPDDLLKFGAAVGPFNEALEDQALAGGWFREKPSAAVTRWRLRGIGAIVLGGAGVAAGASIPMDGLVLLSGAFIAGGIVLLVMAGWMPAVTMSGAMIRAQLAAYRRTLRKTMEMARSMDQVVAEAGLDWLDTPDQAIVWGTALGLQGEIEEVLKRSLEDVEAGRTTVGSTYLPTWYRGSGGSSFADAGRGGGGSIFSSSGIPNIGGMMSALGTIGNSPSSSGSGGGGGGFSGGSSGGGGGGAGGGF